MQERKINQSNAMQCFKASDGSSNSSRRARAAEELPISEEDIPAAMDAVKKITKNQSCSLGNLRENYALQVQQLMQTSGRHLGKRDIRVKRATFTCAR